MRVPEMLSDESHRIETKGFSNCVVRMTLVVSCGEYHIHVFCY